MVNQNEAKAFVRLQRNNLKARLGRFYASTLESKIARTFTDDVDICHGATRRIGSHYRPGLRDDASSCVTNAMLRVL
jgi:hypothetical protein